MTEEKKAPLIGDFKEGPPGNAPRTSPPLQRKDDPQEDVSELDTERSKAEVETILKDGGAPLTSEELAKQYLEGLEREGISQEEARRIQDVLLSELVYTEEARLSSKVSILMRTRIYTDVERTLRLIENEAPQLPMHVNDLLARYNVAASLARYKDTIFKFPQMSMVPTDEEKVAVEAAFDVRLNFIMSLPTPVMGKLIDSIAEFDEKLRVILSKGAPEDF